MNFIVRLVLNSIILLAIDYFFESISLSSWWTAVITIIVLSIVNTIIKPILAFFTFPITLITLGLFYFVINGFTLYLTSLIVSGFEINSFLSAIIAAFLLSIFSLLFNKKEK